MHKVAKNTTHCKKYPPPSKINICVSGGGNMYIPDWPRNKKNIPPVFLLDLQ